MKMWENLKISVLDLWLWQMQLFNRIGWEKYTLSLGKCRVGRVVDVNDPEMLNDNQRHPNALGSSFLALYVAAARYFFWLCTFQQLNVWEHSIFWGRPRSHWGSTLVPIWTRWPRKQFTNISWKNFNWWVVQQENRSHHQWTFRITIIMHQKLSGK